MQALVLPSVLGDSLSGLNRLLREADAATGIPTRLLYRDPPLHPTATELTEPDRRRLQNAFWAARRQNARPDAGREKGLPS
jgi:hypothetical protein